MFFPVETKPSKALETIKETLTRPPILAFYDPRYKSGSCFGLGVVILQRAENKLPWKPVAYALCTMTDTETHYVQIDKSVGSIWARERFSMVIHVTKMCDI